MALTDLPGNFFAPTRQDIHARWLRDYRIRNPGVDTSPGSRPYIDGLVVADTILPIYADAIAVGNNADLANKTSRGLEIEAANLGLPERLPASGAVGFVTISASTGGGLVQQNAELKDDKTGLRFKAQITSTYFDAQPVPIIGVDTGPATNLAAGTVLRWTTTPIGIGETATVLATPDGKGLTGGRDKETDPELVLRIADARANPAASGNAAAVRRFAKEGAAALGIPLQEVFVFPASAGPGTTAFVFTLRPASPGASRTPTSVQIAAILAHVMGELPGDDGLFACSILESAQTLKLQIQWARGATGWADAQTWPVYADDFYVTGIPSALTFDVTSVAGSPTAPQVGKTIAFYDTANARFVEKRILTVSGTGPSWTITCDTTNNASDTSYVPSVSERFCPWSDSLDLLAQPLLIQVGTLGPGEMFSDFFDEGYRQRRDPPSPDVWPSVLRNKDLELALGKLPAVADVVIASPTLPYATPVGTANVSVNLTTVGKILAFPL